MNICIHVYNTCTYTHIYVQDTSSERNSLIKSFSSSLTVAVPRVYTMLSTGVLSPNRYTAVPICTHLEIYAYIIHVYIYIYMYIYIHICMMYVLSYRCARICKYTYVQCPSAHKYTLRRISRAICRIPKYHHGSFQKAQQ